MPAPAASALGGSTTISVVVGGLLKPSTRTHVGLPTEARQGLISPTLPAFTRESLWSGGSCAVSDAGVERELCPVSQANGLTAAPKYGDDTQDRAERGMVEAAGVEPARVEILSR